MYNILQPLVKYLKVQPVKIYDSIFILHSKVTVAFLFACVIIISAKEYFGVPIHCKVDGDMKEFVSNYCWVMGTYIWKDNSHVVGKDSISYGVFDGIEGIDEKIYQRYYQWVVLFLVLQAITFLMPAFLWKMWEGGRLQQLCRDLGDVFVPDEWHSRRKNLLASYFTNNNHDFHLAYTFKYYFCELLNFVVCISNIILMNIFFTGFWYKFAPAIGSIPLYNWDDWNEHSSLIFPKMAKCDFFKYGATNSIEVFDALCLLPLNILNEKLFAFLFLWFIFLTIISGINVVYRIFTVFSRNYRFKLMKAQLGSLTSKQINVALENTNIGDWFLMYKVGRNVNGALFTDLMENIIELKKTSADDHIF